MVYVTLAVFNLFFVSHYVFRWRTAMNDYYTAHWEKLRHIEGASQRIQEDTMRFGKTTEQLSVSLIESLILMAFLPILYELSSHVKVLPIVGEIPHALMWASIGWAVLGTVILMIVGMKLPDWNSIIRKLKRLIVKSWFMVKIMLIVLTRLPCKNCLAG